MSDTDERRLDAQIPQAQTSERVRTDGVIRTKEEEALWDRMNARHILDKHESATDLMCITDSDKAKSKFEIYDPKADSKGPRVIEKAATQAVEPIPPVSESIKNAPDSSPVVLNIQITNVPEVSKGVAPQQWIQHIDTTFAAGAQAVKPIEQWMATQNAVNDALIGIGPALDNAVNYYANTPVDQVVSDVQGVLGTVGGALDKTFSIAHAPEERAKTAGEIMPFVFTDGLGTTGESATLKTADAVATQVDAAVMQTIEKSLDAIKAAPDLAADIKQGLYDFLKGQQLTVQQVEAAGIPRGFFDDIPRGATKDDTFFAMSKAEEGDGVPKRTSVGKGEINYQLDKETGRPQRSDLGKLRQPYHWPVINEQFSDDIVRQSTESSCVSAVGEMLSEGVLSEKVLIKALGTPSDVKALAKELGNGWTSENRSFSSLAEVSKHGAWAAQMLEREWTRFPKPPHVVIVDGVNSMGNVVIRDPLEGTRYEMTQADFLKTWNRNAAYRWPE